MISRVTLAKLARYFCVVATAAGVLLGLSFVAIWATNYLSCGADFHAYWIADPVHPYLHQGTVPDAFQYTPAAALVSPLLRLIPFALALTIWRIGQLSAIVATAGPWSLLVLLTYPVASEMNLGNINILIGLAILAGFRWPALWAFVLLTKPTCGVGLLWFLVRRDWRSLRLALGVTAALAAISFILVPGAWFEYARYVLGEPAPEVQGFPVLWLRLPVAIAVAIITGKLGWRPGMIIASWLALPVWWYVSPSLLVAALAFTWPSPLVGKGGPDRVVRPDKAGWRPTWLGTAQSAMRRVIPT
jgi:hypothetical protein